MELWYNTYNYANFIEVIKLSKSDMNKLSSSDILMGVFLCIVIAIIPVVCRLNQVSVSADEYNIIRSGNVVNDIFSHGKAVLIIVMGVVMAAFMAFQIFSEDGFTIDFKSKPVILAGVYIILALLSALFSSYKSTSFNGISERYEGFWVWLCYMIFMVIAMAFSRNRKRLDIAVACIMLSGFLVGVVGFLQFLGFNIFTTDFGAKLIMGDLYNGKPLNIRFDAVFSTLYNPNCAGMYFGMMFSAIGVMAFFMPADKKIKWVMVALAIMLGICAVGTHSVGGILGIAVGIGFTLAAAVCYNVFKLRSKKAIVFTISGIIACILAVILLFATNSVIAQKIKIISDALKNSKTIQSSASYYEDFNVDGMKGEIITKGGVYSIDYAEQATQFMHNGTVLDPVEIKDMDTEGGKQYIFNEDGITWNMYLYNNYATIMAEDAGGTETYFMFGEVDGTLCILDKFGNAVDMSAPAESFGFEGIERLGSNRGYIWSRSIPLLKKHIILGSGPDSFVLEFPQNDVKSKLQFLGNPYVIVDKPHNIFLQTGINTGVLSLIVLMALYILFIVKTIKSVFAEENASVLTAIRLGIMAGVIAYLFAGLTTDSVVSVAPVFWSMLGIGFGAADAAEED